MKKRDLYRDVLQVPEYFIFDPTEDYLKPPLQGFRLVDGEYARIEPVAGRLPSDVLGLHLERDGEELRLYDPARRSRVLRPIEGLLRRKSSASARKTNHFAVVRAQVNEAVLAGKTACRSSRPVERQRLGGSWPARHPQPSSWIE